MEFNVILLMMVMMSLVAQLAAEFLTAKPGCADLCGNVSIPFPFGLSGECSLNYDFKIDCKSSSSSNSFTPFWRNLAIDSISVEKGHLKVFHPIISFKCYLDAAQNTLDYTFSPFTIDNTTNLFFVAGCSAYGRFKGGLSTGESKRELVFGCIGFCDSDYIHANTSCSVGYGCCQTTVPSELTSFSMLLSVPQNEGDCSYSFVAEKTALDDYIPKQEGSINRTSVFPVVLSWSVSSNKSCGIDLKNSSIYACKEGSSCQNVGVQSYRCVCSKGYEGNPYLGCTDIDECARLDHDCVQDCLNIRGGYICQCRTGYYGDGRKNSGIGCIQKTRSNKSIVLVAVGGTTLGVSLLLAVTYLLYKTVRKRRNRNRRNRFFKKNGGKLLDTLSLNGNNIEKVHIFTAKELVKATDHFNDNRVLGRGGQGTVYKGMLSDGKIIAVKKSKLADAIQVEQFINEVVILSYLEHRNVVRLLGCCLETEVPLLVYEFIPNGTLYDLIHNSEGDDFPLSWEVRLRIATEVARALSYLHTTTSIPVYHRDVKSSNILLGEKYRAKVSDFGISRHISIEQTHLTTTVKGTFGYLDPEYFQSSQFTEKSDVYSFGVVLVELLTSRKPHHYSG